MEDYNIAVVAVVEYDGYVLLGKKIHKPGHAFSDAWHVPGGKHESHENDEQALVREMGQEAGIRIRVERFLDERTEWARQGNSMVPVLATGY